MMARRRTLPFLASISSVIEMLPSSAFVRNAARHAGWSCRQPALALTDNWDRHRFHVTCGCGCGLAVVTCVAVCSCASGQPHLNIAIHAGGLQP